MYQTYLNSFRMTEESFSFLNSFNMGYEGFSKPLSLARSHPVYGNKGEFFFLFGLIALVPLVKGARKSNEDSLRSEVKTNNRYADMGLSHHDRKPSTWSQ